MLRPLSLTFGIASFGFLCMTPQSSEAFGRRGCREDFSRPVYYAPAPTTYGGPAYYHPAPIYGEPYVYQAPIYGQPTYSPSAPTTTATVVLSDNEFEPPTITVASGTTVRWTNNGVQKHTVTSTAGEWDSGDLGPGKIYSATFTRPGTYEYFCVHHNGMRGSVVVK